MEPGPSIPSGLFPSPKMVLVMAGKRQVFQQVWGSLHSLPTPGVSLHAPHVVQRGELLFREL